MDTSRGLRNNNPLNIRHNSDKFLGETSVRKDPAFKSFISMPYGYRAAFVILANYNKVGANTIDEIIKKWAPPTENRTESYINNVVSRSGVGRFQNLTLRDGELYIKIVSAMCLSENGVPAFPLDVAAGLSLQNLITK